MVLHLNPEREALNNIEQLLTRSTWTCHTERSRSVEPWTV